MFCFIPAGPVLSKRAVHSGSAAFARPAPPALFAAKSPNTVGPEPVMTALSAPQRSITSLRYAISRDSSAVRTSSNTFPICRATAPKFPAARACFMASWSGRRPSFSTRTRPKSAGVDKPNSGLHTTIAHAGSGGRSVSTSPRPSASAVPPRTQKGTSLPT